MPVITRSSAGSMDVRCFCIYIFLYTDKALNFIVIVQRQRIHFHIQWNFIPVDVPAIIFPELFQISPAFNPKDYRIFQLTGGSIAQTGNNLIDPYRAFSLRPLILIADAEATVTEKASTTTRTKARNRFMGQPPDHWNNSE